MRLVRCALAASAFLLSLATIAHADEPSPEVKRQAKAHFKQGRAYQDAGAFDDAIKEYQTAYQLVPLPELLFNIGQAYRLKGDKQSALAAYRRFLEAAPEANGSDEARVHVARITKEMEGDRGKHPDAPPPPPPDPSKVVPTSEPPPTPTTSSEAPAVAVQAGPTNDTAHTMRVAGIASAATGVGAIGLGIIYGVLAQQQSDKVSHARRWDASIQSALDDGNGDQTKMYVFYGVGGALLVAGGALYYYGMHNAAERAQSPPRVSLAPQVGPSGAGMEIRGAF
jgi:tetratricopeptide (TPR) repeat protein